MKKYILNKQVRLKHDEAYDKFYAFCIDTGDHFTLNKTGFTILSILNEEKSLDDIVTLLSEEIIVDEKAVFKDTIHFLELSEKNGIIAYM
ncbi:MAG TPA: PqqD family protein [Bacteroidales bacterium]|nr:PqqD family protein [Bacteroidales bacterium]